MTSLTTRLLPSTSIDLLASLGQPAWDAYYGNTARLDMFDTGFLQSMATSGAEWLPIGLFDGEQLVCFAVAMGHDALLFGKPVRLANVSWMTTVRGGERQHHALHLYREIGLLLRARGYQIAVGLTDGHSHTRRMLAKHACGVEGVHGPIPLCERSAWARVFSSEAAHNLRLPATDRFLLRITGGTRPVRAAPGIQSQTLAAQSGTVHASVLEARLRGTPAHDLAVVYESPGLLAGALSGSPYEQLVELRRGENEPVGLVQLLKLPMLGAERVGTAIIERAWFAPGQEHMARRALLRALGEAKIGLVLAPHVFEWSERCLWLRAGLLPDLTRPLCTYAWVLDDALLPDVRRVRSCFVPFR